MKVRVCSVFIPPHKVEKVKEYVAREPDVQLNPLDAEKRKFELVSQRVIPHERAKAYLYNPHRKAVTMHDPHAQIFTHSTTRYPWWGVFYPSSTSVGIKYVISLSI